MGPIWEMVDSKGFKGIGVLLPFWLLLCIEEVKVLRFDGVWYVL